MRKLLYMSTAARTMTVTALCVVVGACSETTAPAAPSAAAHSSAAATREARQSASDDPDGSAPIAVFVIGDAESNDIGATVNFWGAQWWKNNQMSDTVSSGVASFKGFATTSANSCGGTWQSRPGNSYNPPSTLDEDIAVIVTSTVIKNGAAIRGDIKRIVMVHHDGNYGPNPGHSGNGVITEIVCDGGSGTAT